MHFRIDHLLGRNLIENLTVLRFSNLVFEPLWSRTYIRNIQVRLFILSIYLTFYDVTNLKIHLSWIYCSVTDLLLVIQIILSEDLHSQTRRWPWSIISLLECSVNHRFQIQYLIFFTILCRYFEGYGIIRDIVHSHILQTIALLAMEPPISLDGEDIRNEKVIDH